MTVGVLNQRRIDAPFQTVELTVQRQNHQYSLIKNDWISRKCVGLAWQPLARTTNFFNAEWIMPRLCEKEGVEKLYCTPSTNRLIHAKGKELEANLFDLTDNGLTHETTIAGTLKISRKDIGTLQLSGMSLVLMDQIGGTSLEVEACNKDVSLRFILTNDKGVKSEAAFNSVNARLFAELLLQLCDYQEATALDGEDEN